MATFELWNADSGNLLGTFTTEAEALTAVYDAVRRNGESYGDCLALGRESSSGRSKIVASGRDLVLRAAGQTQVAATVNEHPSIRTRRPS